MFAFALAVGLDDDDLPDPKASVRVMASAWPYGEPERTELLDTPRGSAALLRWTVVSHDESARPHWDKDARTLFVGDVRIYNRADVLRSLELQHQDSKTSDLELMRRAFLKWGSRCVEFVSGDFAFAVWNEHEKTLFVARDHLGVRPLLFKVEGGAVMVASDVVPIFEASRRSLRIDARAVLNRLLGAQVTEAATYFEGIEGVPGGHYAVISPKGVTLTRYWGPKIEAEEKSYDEHCSAIAEAFSQAVYARLDSDRPIVAHSSGGFDSSTIIMEASRIYLREPDRPPLTMSSAVAPGFASDESRFIDAVAKSVQFRDTRWSVLDTSFDDVQSPAIAAPGLLRGLGGGRPDDLEVAVRQGARVLLAGVLGDTVMSSFGVLRDFFRHGRWREVATHLLRTKGLRRRLRIGSRSVLGLLPPDRALRMLALVQRRRFRRPERWMGPRLRALYPVEQGSQPVSYSSSHLTEELWSRVTDSTAATVVTGMVAHGLQANLEVRMPFCDHRFVETVLKVPWHHRSPKGDGRRLARDSLGRILPIDFRSRVDQASWLPVWAHHSRRLLPVLAGQLEERDWVSAPFVERQAIREMCAAAARKQDPSSEVANFLGEVAILTAWLKRLRDEGKCDI